MKILNISHLIHDEHSISMRDHAASCSGHSGCRKQRGSGIGKKVCSVGFVSFSKASSRLY